MNNALLLNELKMMVNKNTLDLNKYYNLIDKIKIEIATEANKETTTKQRITFINNFIKNNKFLQKRPILKYYDDTQFAGYKAFTDSFFMVLLKEADSNGLQWLPFTEYIKENPNYNYPTLNRIVNFNFKNDYLNTLELKVNDILNDIKAAGKPNIKNGDFDTAIKYYFIDSSDGVKKPLGFGALNMKAFITFMNYKPSDTITFYFKNQISPAFSENKNGSIGLILPIRLND